MQRLPVVGGDLAERWAAIAASPGKLTEYVGASARAIALWIVGQVGTVAALVIQLLLTVIIAAILAETSAEIPIRKAVVRHRLGRVELGDPTILIAVSAAHRDEAYRASRRIIDRIKHEAPIWKREILRDGTGQWSRGCTAGHASGSGKTA